MPYFSMFEDLVSSLDDGNNLLADRPRVRGWFDGTEPLGDCLKEVGMLTTELIDSLRREAYEEEPIAKVSFVRHVAHGFEFGLCSHLNLGNGNFFELVTAVSDGPLDDTANRDRLASLVWTVTKMTMRCSTRLGMMVTGSKFTRVLVRPYAGGKIVIEGVNSTPRNIRHTVFKPSEWLQHATLWTNPMNTAQHSVTATDGTTDMDVVETLLQTYQAGFAFAQSKTAEDNLLNRNYNLSCNDHKLETAELFDSILPPATAMAILEQRQWRIEIVTPERFDEYIREDVESALVLKSLENILFKTAVVQD